MEEAKIHKREDMLLQYSDAALIYRDLFAFMVLVEYYNTGVHLCTLCSLNQLNVVAL